MIQLNPCKPCCTDPIVPCANCVDAPQNSNVTIYDNTDRTTVLDTGVGNSVGRYCPKVVGGTYWVKIENGSITTTKAINLCGIFLAGCPCTNIPKSLSLNVQSQPPAGVPSFVFPATLVYQTKPDDLANYRSDAVGYYGTNVETESVNFQYRFRYWFGCSGGFYFLQFCMTPDSPIGFPGVGLIMNWLTGFPGNTCSPFHLSNGSASASLVYKLQGISITG